MNPHIRDEWVRRLLSGNYRQGRAYLNWTDSTGNTYFCCLGVLCEAAADQGIVTRVPYSNVSGVIGYQSRGHGSDQSSTVLPQAVKRWAGLLSVNPLVKAHLQPGPDNGAFDLAHLNDQYSLPFGRLATLIERQL